jgi:hypothetical protein
LWRATPVRSDAWVRESFSLELWLTNNRRVGHRANRCSPSVIGVAKPTKLREEAINGDDGDRTVRMIQEALGIEPLLPKAPGLVEALHHTVHGLR